MGDGCDVNLDVQCAMMDGWLDLITLNRASAGRLCPINILFMGSAGGAAAL